MSRRKSPRARLRDWAHSELSSPVYGILPDLTRLLKRGPTTMEEMVLATKSTEDVVRDGVELLHQRGFNVVERGGLWSVERALAPSRVDVLTLESDEDGGYLFGLVADTHIGSTHARLDVIHDLYDRFLELGITDVLHAGNWIDGEFRYNKHELVPEAHGMQAQLDLFVKEYPQRPGIVTHYIAGDDHEGWYAQREGVDIGRMLQRTAEEAGRSDLNYLGYKEAFVRLEHARTKRHARLLLDHPGGGSAYAHSYAPQKIMESLQSGEKPAVYAGGHFHKALYSQIREVHCFLVPCTKDLDTFGRKKRLQYAVGGIVVRLQQDEGGPISACIPEFRMYWDRGYYNDQFAMGRKPTKVKA